MSSSPQPYPQQYSQAPVGHPTPAGWHKLRYEDALIGIFKLIWALITVGVFIWWGRELVLALGDSQGAGIKMWEERWLWLAVGMFIFNLMINTGLNMLAELIRGFTGDLEGVTWSMQVWNVVRKFIMDTVFGLISFFVIFYNSLGLAEIFRRMFFGG